MFIITVENCKLVIITVGFSHPPPGPRESIMAKLKELGLPWIEAPWRTFWSDNPECYISDKEWLKKHTVA